MASRETLKSYQGGPLGSFGTKLDQRERERMVAGGRGRREAGRERAVC